MILEEVAAVLESIGAPYALIGGRAVGVRGYVRSTLDYDFLTADPRVMQRETWHVMEEAGANIDIRKGDPFDPLAGVVHVTLADGEEGDVILAKWKWEAGVLERAERLPMRGLSIPVPTTSDLILLKLAAGGPGDHHDVMQLLKAASDREQLIRDVEERIADLKSGPRKAWQRIRAER